MASLWLAVVILLLASSTPVNSAKVIQCHMFTRQLGHRFCIEWEPFTCPSCPICQPSEKPCDIVDLQLENDRLKSHISLLNVNHTHKVEKMQAHIDVLQKNQKYLDRLLSDVVFIKTVQKWYYQLVHVLYSTLPDGFLKYTIGLAAYGPVLQWLAASGVLWGAALGAWKLLQQQRREKPAMHPAPMIGVGCKRKRSEPEPKSGALSETEAVSKAVPEPVQKKAKRKGRMLTASQ
jgi:hypothetical protein